jgi:hypothetical protein
MSLIVIPNAKEKHDLGPLTSARAMMAKTPGPGVILKIKTAIKNETPASKDIRSNLDLTLKI